MVHPPYPERRPHACYKHPLTHRRHTLATHQRNHPPTRTRQQPALPPMPRQTRTNRLPNQSTSRRRGTPRRPLLAHRRTTTTRLRLRPHHPARTRRTRQHRQRCTKPQNLQRTSRRETHTTTTHTQTQTNARRMDPKQRPRRTTPRPRHPRHDNSDTHIPSPGGKDPGTTANALPRRSAYLHGVWAAKGTF